MTMGWSAEQVKTHLHGCKGRMEELLRQRREMRDNPPKETPEQPLGLNFFLNMSARRIRIIMEQILQLVHVLETLGEQAWLAENRHLYVASDAMHARFGLSRASFEHGLRTRENLERRRSLSPKPPPPPPSS